MNNQVVAQNGGFKTERTASEMQTSQVAQPWISKGLGLITSTVGRAVSFGVNYLFSKHEKAESCSTEDWVMVKAKKTLEEKYEKHLDKLQFKGFLAFLEEKHPAVYSEYVEYSVKPQYLEYFKVLKEPEDLKHLGLLRNAVSPDHFRQLIENSLRFQDFVSAVRSANKELI